MTLAEAVTRTGGFDIVAGRSGSLGLVEADAAALPGCWTACAPAGAYDVGARSRGGRRSRG